jgi:hypothetical protein
MMNIDYRSIGDGDSNIEIEIYGYDLTEECQRQILELFPKFKNWDELIKSYNWDVLPMTTIIMDDDSENESEDEDEEE